MKKIPIILSAVILTVSVFAFTKAKTSPKADLQTFYYYGSDYTTQSSLNDPSNYSRVAISDRSCDGNQALCSIKAVDSSGYPVIDKGDVNGNSQTGTHNYSESYFDE